MSIYKEFEEFLERRGPSLAEFYDVLERHDWYYYFSDDMSVHNKGELAQKNVEAMAKLSVEHGTLFDAFNAHVFSGKPWGTERAPKPIKPV